MYTIIMINIGNKVKKIYIDRVYRKIIILAFILHIVFSVLFSFLHYDMLIKYNIASAIFYILMILLVPKRMFRTIVLFIHVEVMMFVSISTYYLGWNTGYPLYLLALASLTYFCPFKLKCIPYLFGIIEAALFIYLRLYFNEHVPIFINTDNFNLHMYLTNCACCFFIILYASYLFGISTTNLTEKLETENTKLNKVAYYDQLTGSYTRYHFLKYIKNMDQESYGIAIFDLDDFKLVNDTYGHNCGDYILNETIRIIRKKESENINITRWGGEEFIILFTSPISKEDLFKELQLIRKTIESYDYIYEGIHIKITITLGACIANKNDDINEVINKIDNNLYKGKNSGKNCVILES